MKVEQETTIENLQADTKMSADVKCDQMKMETTTTFAEDDAFYSNESRLADRKIFVGGLCWETTDADLHAYFSQFGRIQTCQIKYDNASQQPRGFGFVVFEDADSVRRVLSIRDQHHVCGKRVDPKPAKPSKDVSRKVFVGGLSPETSFEQIHEYFSQFGKVESLDLPFDSAKCSRKNYVFVAYATKQEASAAARHEKQFICGRSCDVRIALPRDEILKLKSRGLMQVPIKYSAPQSLMPAAVYARNFSGPPTTVAHVGFAPPRQPQQQQQMQPQQQAQLQSVMQFAPTRFRAPYRSSPSGSATGIGFNRSMVNACDMAPQLAPMAQQAHPQQPPFQITLQGGSNGQLSSPYQLCLLEQQPMQQMTYTPYFSAPPSMLATAPMQSMMLGGNVQQQQQQPDLMCCHSYAYTTDGYLTQLDMANGQLSNAGVISLSNGMPIGLGNAQLGLGVGVGGVMYASLPTAMDQPTISFTQSSTDSGIEFNEQQKAAVERTNERHVG